MSWLDNQREQIQKLKLLREWPLLSREQREKLYSELLQAKFDQLDPLITRLLSELA
jgi:ribosomal protein L19E